MREIKKMKGFLGNGMRLDQENQARLDDDQYAAQATENLHAIKLFREVTGEQLSIQEQDNQRRQHLQRLKEFR